MIIILKDLITNSTELRYIPHTQTYKVVSLELDLIIDTIERTCFRWFRPLTFVILELLRLMMYSCGIVKQSLSCPQTGSFKMLQFLYITYFVYIELFVFKTAARWIHSDFKFVSFVRFIFLFFVYFIIIFILCLGFVSFLSFFFWIEDQQ